MILIDSSVLIDWLGHRTTAQTNCLDYLLTHRFVVGVGDLMLVEVLQGARSDSQFAATKGTLLAFPAVLIGGHDVAAMAARHYRHLRTLGSTPRKTIDTLIATRCILDSIPLLYADRDYDPFVQHLGLRSAMDLLTGAD